MNNQTSKSIAPHGLNISLGHLASIFSLLFILILILITLFLLFNRRKNNCVFDDNEPSGISRSGSERKSFPFRRSRHYSSATSGQYNPPSRSFQMDVDDRNTRSTINLISTK